MQIKDKPEIVCNDPKKEKQKKRKKMLLQLPQHT